MYPIRLLYVSIDIFDMLAIMYHILPYVFGYALLYKSFVFLYNPPTIFYSSWYRVKTRSVLLLPTLPP
jgi:hypothetical protein